VLGEHKLTNANITRQYFYQDLIVASYIYKKKPNKHIDIGSRVDGFVANIASFREIEIFDIRKSNLNYKNIISKELDLQKDIPKNLELYTDSLSCLHTLEHIGLGRYGDDIDSNGHINAFLKLIKILQPNGTLYVSFPVSNKNKIYFNSERRFCPKDILNWSDEVKLTCFDLIDDNEKIHYDLNLEQLNSEDIFNSCGIYTFTKINK